MVGQDRDVLAAQISQEERVVAGVREVPCTDPRRLPSPSAALARKLPHRGFALGVPSSGQRNDDAADGVGV